MAECETCGGEGTVIVFRRFAGEYMAGEPVEVRCEDCDGEGEIEDDDSPRPAFIDPNNPPELRSENRGGWHE